MFIIDIWSLMKNGFCRQEDEEEEEAKSASEDEAVEENAESCQDEQVVREGEVTNQEGVQFKEKPEVVDVVEEFIYLAQFFTKAVGRALHKE